MTLTEKCPECSRVAKATNETVEQNVRLIFLDCGHVVKESFASNSPFETITFDGDESCQHEWDKTICVKCNAKKLYPFQIEGARALERANGKLGIFDEMGLGKTIQVLAYLKFHPELRPVLWVTKAGTMFQHAREIVRVLGKKDVPFILDNGKITSLFPKINVVASYDIFRRLSSLDMFEQFKCIVLDECQAIKNPDSTRTQLIRKIAKNIPSIIPLSGTPWKNRGSEFFVILNLLDSKMFYSFENFKHRYVDYYWDGNRYKEGGIRDPKGFKKQVSHIVIRRERQEVLPELPVINRTRLLCKVEEHAQIVYRQEEEKLARIYNDAVISGEEDSFETNASIMQSLIIMRQVTGIAKCDATINYATEFLEETDRKLVIFVHHIKCGEIIYNKLSKWCEENNYPKVLVLRASMDAQERAQVAEKFNGPDHRVLIASTLASGEGMNLQSCSDCVMHERQWNPANEEQAEGRFIRIGQTATSVNAVYVHAENTIDIDLDSIVTKKRIAFHNAMNNGEIPRWNENDIVKELVKGIADRYNKSKK